MLKDFPNELNYALFVYWKRNAGADKKIIKKVHRERAEEYEKKVNYAKLNPVFWEKLKPWESLPHGATGILRGPLGRTNRISPPLRRTATVTLCMSFLKI